MVPFHLPQERGAAVSHEMPVARAGPAMHFVSISNRDGQILPNRHRFPQKTISAVGSILRKIARNFPLPPISIGQKLGLVEIEFFA